MLIFICFYFLRTIRCCKAVCLRGALGKQSCYYIYVHVRSPSIGQSAAALPMRECYYLTDTCPVYAMQFMGEAFCFACGGDLYVRQDSNDTWCTWTTSMNYTTCTTKRTQSGINNRTMGQRLHISHEKKLMLAPPLIWEKVHLLVFDVV